MSFGNTIAYALLRSFAWLLSWMPLCVHRFNGKVLGWLVGDVIGYRKKVVEQNLANSFPSMSPEERADVCRRFYTHLCTIFCEAFWFGSTTSYRRLDKSDINMVSNPEVLSEFYIEGRSVMILAAHTGNFEVMSSLPWAIDKVCSVPVYREKDMVCTYKKLSNPVWDKFMRINRTASVRDKKHYDGNVESDHVMLYVVRHRSEAKMYIFITDQYPYGKTGQVPVRFMGQDTFSMIGGVSLAQAMHMPVVYMGMSCRPEGGYKTSFTVICKDAAQEDVAEITSKYYALLERDIRTQPWNYLWSHRRWKKR